MRHARLLVAILAASACVERALDGASSSAPSVDLARADLRDVDLRGVDLASGAPGVDLATTIVDLATSSQVGVPCSGAVCSTAEVCCALSGVQASKCFPSMGGGCPFMNDGYRCDGPEDCPAGQRCYGREVSFGGTPAQTRCRGMAGPGALVVCHADADCPSGGTCSSVPLTQPGGPPLEVCK